VELNQYGLEWVDSCLDKIDEDAVYASIGAYDPEAYAAYFRLEKERLTGIALKYQDDPEFQMRNQPVL
jgi:hypothetical protein